MILALTLSSHCTKDDSNEYTIRTPTLSTDGNPRRAPARPGTSRLARQHGPPTPFALPVRSGSIPANSMPSSTHTSRSPRGRRHMSSDNEQVKPAAPSEEPATAATPAPKQKHAPHMKYRPRKASASGHHAASPYPRARLRFRSTDTSAPSLANVKITSHACVIGVCEHCGKPITGVKRRSRTARFCSRKCDADFRNEQLCIPTGCFRPLIEEYRACDHQLRSIHSGQR